MASSNAVSRGHRLLQAEFLVARCQLIQRPAAAGFRLAPVREDILGADAAVRAHLPAGESAHCRAAAPGASARPATTRRPAASVSSACSVVSATPLPCAIWSRISLSSRYAAEGIRTVSVTAPNRAGTGSVPSDQRLQRLPRMIRERPRPGRSEQHIPWSLRSVRPSRVSVMHRQDRPPTPQTQQVTQVPPTACIKGRPGWQRPPTVSRRRRPGASYCEEVDALPLQRSSGRPRSVPDRSQALFSSTGVRIPTRDFGNAARDPVGGGLQRIVRQVRRISRLSPPCCDRAISRSL